MSLESSLPPFAHFLSALNIFRWRWRRYPDIVLSLHQPRSPMFSKWNTMKHSKSSLAVLPSNSWPRWWLAWLPSQNICAYHWGFWDIRFCHAPLQVHVRGAISLEPSKTKLWIILWKIPLVSSVSYFIEKKKKLELPWLEVSCDRFSDL